MRTFLNFKLSNTIYIIPIFSIVLTLSIVVGVFVYFENKLFNEKIKELHISLEQEKKDMLKDEVSHVLKNLEFGYVNRINKLEVDVKERVDEAYTLVENLHKKFNTTKSKEEIVQIAIEALREQRFFSGNGYYFLFDLEGTTLLSPITPEVEGTKKLLDFQDINGKYPLREILKELQRNKDGFYIDWTYLKLNNLAEQGLKRGYIRFFEPYSLAIATAEYLYQVEEKLKVESLSALRTLENDLKFMIIENKTKEIIYGKLNCPSIREEHNIQKIKLNTKINEYFALECKSHKHLVYTMLYSPWDWLIVSDVLLDDVQSSMKQKEVELKSKIKNRLLIVVLLLVLLSIVIFVFVNRIQYIIYKNLDIFINFFKKIEDTNSYVDIEELSISEFRELGNHANEVMAKKIENEEKINQQNLEIKQRSLVFKQYANVIDSSLIVSKTDPKGIITYVNEEFCRVSGYSKEELIGKSHNIIRDPEAPKSVFYELWQTIKSKKIWKGVLKNRKKSGEFYYVKSVVSPILNLAGEIEEYIAVRNEVTDLILQEKLILKQTTDELTLLPNRQKLFQDLAVESDFRLAIFDILDFKEINEHYGFAVGDRLLIKVKEVLQDIIQTHPSLKLYRLPGDEFALLSEKCPKENFLEVCKKITNRFKKRDFVDEEVTYTIELVCGVSFQKNFFINAEMALNHAKSEAQEIIVFDENTGIKEQLEKNILMTRKLRYAIEHDKITVFIQPIINRNKSEISRYECLIRMIDEEGKIVSPFFFLDVAKKANLYHKLTRIVIEKSFNYFKDREDSFSLNLTIEDILNKETISTLFTKIDENNQLRGRVTLEIVEDEGIENYVEVSDFITKAKEKGFLIAIDDFGTGYSNFEYLMKLNADFIKIDGSLIKHIHIDKNAKVVTELIVSFAQKLHIKTVAEFVHSEEVLQAVREMNIDYFQGFHLGEPKPID